MEQSILKTRRFIYDRLSNGRVVARPRNQNVTKHSFVNSRAIEHKKRAKKAKKSPVKVVAAPPKERRVNFRALRAAVNARAKRAKKVYPTINLDLSLVPKPILIRNKKHQRKTQ